MLSHFARVGLIAGLTGMLVACAGGSSESSSSSVDPDPAPGPSPTVSLDAADTSLDSGEATTLSWSAANANTCDASGGWTGARRTSGSESTGSLTTSQTYSLTCTGNGQRVTDSVTVTINGSGPSLSLSAADSLIDSGDTTTLTWSGTDATSCTASGGWSGDRATDGSEVVGPLTDSTSFTLTCDGAGGTAVSTTTVDVTGILNVAWVAPTENTDGTPLTDLDSYRIYYGNTSGDYLDWVEVTDSTAVDHAVAVASGTYYVAMTAFDAEGNESAYSNEVLRATE